ncbi:DNA-binding response regulator, OmpR family, contains REC and winged-helix (wHTH) domain [Clostridium collagenovorans DSM 3089]|uniref:Stage 0 sporulation protein A homolog n=1 Tax=Clostridium collagenovorans DSM 3089 TaxID=1121306 RepID=A0A1M5V5M7_9CLOT|nr:response regulator transcription factor [Clostridium collagenovorans]SHH70545.1 DNA-binding response regulator, OmpR family, contains REC and winged-helix (wHTH) domain [Clostridium collagenovorans DSM 3089]
MNGDINILVVEDDLDINTLLCSILSKEGYRVRSAYSGTEAKMCIEQYNYELLLLDLMLPGATGEELIEEIRKIKVMPIIVISAKTSQEDKIKVLKMGADDFICKPFDINEVLARVEVQLRRSTQFTKVNSSNSKLKHKNIILDKDSRQVFINNKEISLTAREYSILELFMENPKKVFTKANLFESVWGSEFLGDDNTVNVHMSNLRSKISKVDEKEEYIQTVWGIGFKLKD